MLFCSFVFTNGFGLIKNITLVLSFTGGDRRRVSVAFTSMVCAIHRLLIFLYIIHPSSRDKYIADAMFKGKNTVMHKRT